MKIESVSDLLTRLYFLGHLLPLTSFSKMLDDSEAAGFVLIGAATADLASEAEAVDLAAEAAELAEWAVKQESLTP